jgi:hypothetical protein
MHGMAIKFEAMWQIQNQNVLRAEPETLLGSLGSTRGTVGFT